MINKVVNIDELLADRSIDFKPISRKYLKVTFFQACIFLLVLFAIIFFLYIREAYTLQTMLIIATIVTILAGLRMFLIWWSFKYRGYCIRDYDLIYRKGILNIEETLVPYNRVQHVKIKRGIWSKMFGLSELILFTAAGNNFNLNIPGLPVAVADQIKMFILDKLKAEIVLTPQLETTEEIDRDSEQKNNTDEAE